MAARQDRRSWVVVGSGFFSLLTLGFTLFGAQYFYVELLERYRQPAAITAGPISIFYSAGYFVGPLCSWFLRRFSHRAAAIVGGLAMTTGFFTAGFSGHIAHVYISYCIAGMGYLFVYGSHTAIIPLYFNEYRYTALGVIHAGLALGLIISPYSMTALLKEYGYTGASIITAGICLQNCVTGALLWPVKTSKSRLLVENDIPEQEEPLAGKEKIEKEEIYEKIAAEDMEETVVNAKLIDRTDVCDIKNQVNKEEKDSYKERKTVLLVKDLSFIVILVTVFTTVLAMSTYNSSVVALATERGISQEHIAMFLTIVCVFDFICRPSFGILFDRPVIKPFVRYLYALLAVTNGLATFLMWFAVSLPGFIAYGTLVFIVSGTLTAQVAGVVSDLFGQKFLLHSLGIVYLAIGTGVTLGPIVTGLLKDFLGTFAAGFALNGGLAAAGGLLMALHLLHKQYKIVKSREPNPLHV